MRDVVIVLPKSIGLPELNQALADSPFEVFGTSEGRLSVLLNGEVVQFLQDQSLSEYYEGPEEKALLATVGSEPNLFLVSFKKTISLGQVLAYAVDRPDALVDNDFGDIESGPNFVQHFREDPGWDWIN